MSDENRSTTVRQQELLHFVAQQGLPAYHARVRYDITERALEYGWLDRGDYLLTAKGFDVWYRCMRNHLIVPEPDRAKYLAIALENAHAQALAWDRNFMRWHPWCPPSTPTDMNGKTMRETIINADDQITVTWTEEATERFTRTVTAAELAELMDCKVSEIAGLLATHDHCLDDHLADWQDNATGDLIDLQRGVDSITLAGKNLYR